MGVLYDVAHEIAILVEGKRVVVNEAEQQVRGVGRSDERIQAVNRFKEPDVEIRRTRFRGGPSIREPGRCTDGLHRNHQHDKTTDQGDSA